MARCDADVAIIDLSMPPLGGVAAIRHIKARHPKTRILALSGTDDLGLAEEALRAGADGFLPKTARPEALAGPLWTIAEGLRVIDGALLDALLSNTRKPPSALLDSLSAQDLRLWTLLATGMETGDIARRMLVSERPAKRMVAALLHKLGVSNRMRLPRWPAASCCSMMLPKPTGSVEDLDRLRAGTSQQPESRGHGRPRVDPVEHHHLFNIVGDVEHVVGSSQTDTARVPRTSHSRR